VVELETPGFDTAAFLASAGLGRRIVQVKAKQDFFSQGDAADSIFYLQKGRRGFPLFPPTGKKPPLRFFPSGILLGKSRWQPWAAFDWRPPPRLLPVQPSR
jgi:CRP/FNR family transcriptional regulator, cyclic AMP receptor protein